MLVWFIKLLSGNVVRFFFSSTKPIARINWKCSRSSLGVECSVCVLVGIPARGAAESPLSFEDNGVRFGLDYTRQGYLT